MSTATTAETTTPAPEFRSLQLWRGGKTIHYAGDATGPNLLVRDAWDAPIRGATEEEREAIEVELFALRIREQEVYCLDSCLVDDMMKNAEEMPRDIGREWTYEQVSGLRPDCSDWDVEQCREFLADRGADLPDPNPWTMKRVELFEALGLPDDDDGEEDTIADTRTDEELRAAVIEGIDDETIDGIDDYRDAVNDVDELEIYEWYRVSSWLAERLLEVGEAVLDNSYGYWWGRTTTGQDNIMDGVFQSVARASINSVKAFTSGK